MYNEIKRIEMNDTLLFIQNNYRDKEKKTIDTNYNVTKAVRCLLIHIDISN